MHALPQKLTDLREEITAGVNRRLLEQKLALEKQLKDSTQHAEETAFCRARELLEPQTSGLGARLGADIAQLREKQVADFASCSKVTDGLQHQLDKLEKDLLAKIINVRSELPTLSARVKSLEESVTKLSEAPGELRQELQDAASQLSGGLERLRSQVNDQSEHAKEKEAGLARREREAAQAAAAREESIEQMVRQASRQASLVEERLQTHVAELSKRTEKELVAIKRSVSREGSSPASPTPTPAQVASNAGMPTREGVDVKEDEAAAAQAEAKPKKTSQAGYTAAGDAESIGRALDAKVQTELQAMRKELSTAVFAVNRAVKEFFAAATHEVREAQEAATVSFQEAASAETRRLCESSRGALAEEAERLRASLKVAEEAAADAAAEARRTVKQSAEEAASEARQLAAGEADRRLARALQLLKSERKSDTEAQVTRERQVVKEVKLELSSSIVACRQECEEAARQAVTSLLVSSAGEGGAWTEAVDAAGRAAADTAQLRLQFAEAREAWDRGQASLRSQLQLYMTREEAASGLAKAAATNGETLIRLNGIDEVLDRQRSELGRLGRCVVDLRGRSDAQDSVTEGLGKELATSLATSRAVSTSLVQGVVRALQVLGLVREELGTEVLPPRASDGTTPEDFALAGLQASDLLQWEKSGQSLATRVEKNWSKRKAQGSRNMLELVERKAEEKDFRSWVTTLRRVGMPTPPSDTSGTIGYTSAVVELPPPPQTPRKLTPLGLTKQVLA